MGMLPAPVMNQIVEQSLTFFVINCKSIMNKMLLGVAEQMLSW